MATVRRLEKRDWLVARGVRLDALAEAPTAFGSTLAREVTFTEDVWRSRVDGNAWFVAEDDGVAAGVVTGYAAPDAPPGERSLVGLWVAPRHRGAGMGDLLVAAVIDWARDEGADTLVLWTAQSNDAALGLYRRHGFRPTGRHIPLPSAPGATQEQFVLPLR